jgi:selenocysteine lyase/cysteine desulfurase
MAPQGEVLTMNRREFLTSAGAVAAATRLGFETTAGAAPAAIDGATRDLFPWAENETFINSAAYHPISVRSAEAMREYVGYRLEGPPAELDDVGAAGRGTGGAKQVAIKEQFAELINAKPTEIAFAQSTADGESTVAAGMELGRSSGNVVIDELHYPGSIYMYKRLEERGLEVRMIAQRDGAIDIEDIDKAVDDDTKLVSLSFVASSNGYRHDLESICDIAHDHGAYVYADVIQGVGAVPLDVRATGLDFCSCSSYKWLMGSRGFGFLYVKESLQESVVKPTRFGHRQFRRFDVSDGTWEPEPGAYRYETGNVSNVGAACVHESLKFILDVGVENIRAHVKPLTDRLQEELPAMGYPRRTPLDNDSPTVTFGLQDAERTAEALKKANIAVTVRRDAIRVSPSVFNNHEDIDKLLGVMSKV